MAKIRQIALLALGCFTILFLLQFFNKADRREDLLKSIHQPVFPPTVSAAPILHRSRLSSNQCTVVSEKDLLSVPRTAHGIPYIIHQIYRSENVPVQYEGFIRQCRAINPRFIHLLWTDAEFERFLSHHYPNMTKYLNHYKLGIEKSDFYRYVLLYHFGGVYMDMDVECLKPLADSLDQFGCGCVLDRELPLQTELLFQRSLCVMNSAMMVRRRHPFLKFVIDRLPVGLSAAYVLDRTGPGFLTERYKEYSLRKPPKEDAVVVADAAFFSPLPDAGQVANFDQKCRRISGTSSLVLRRACERWRQMSPQLDKLRQRARTNAILIHQFLHLGYVWRARSVRTLKNVCKTIPGLSRLKI